MASQPLLSVYFLAGLHAALQWIFVVIDILLAFGFVYALYRGWPYRPVIEPGSHDRGGVAFAQIQVFRERWQSVLRRFAGRTSESMRAAIMEADLLADSMLKEFGLEGENLAERLSKVAPEDLKCLNELWKAHRLRNELAAQAERELSLSDAEETIKGYEALLREIKIL